MELANNISKRTKRDAGEASKTKQRKHSSSKVKKPLSQLLSSEGKAALERSKKDHEQQQEAAKQEVIRQQEVLKQQEMIKQQISENYHGNRRQSLTSGISLRQMRRCSLSSIDRVNFLETTKHKLKPKIIKFLELYEKSENIFASTDRLDLGSGLSALQMKDELFIGKHKNRRTLAGDKMETALEIVECVNADDDEDSLDSNQVECLKEEHRIQKSIEKCKIWLTLNSNILEKC